MTTSSRPDIRVLLVEPHEKPRLITVPHTLESLQSLVNGYIQAVYPFRDPIAIIVDEDGIAHRREPNRLLMDEDGKPYDILKGTFFITGLTENDFGSISDELAEKYTQKYYYPEVFVRVKTSNGFRLLWFKEEPDPKPRVIL